MDFDAIVSKIQAATEYYYNSDKVVIPQIYTNEKKFEGSRIYNNPTSHNKLQKSAERELKRPWQRLSIKYKTLAILNFLKELQEKYPGIDLNLIRYETLLNVENNSELLKTIYNPDLGKIIHLYGYKLEKNDNGYQIIKSNNSDEFLQIKPQICLKLKYS